MTVSVVSAPTTFDRLKDHLRFARTGRFYKLKAGLSYSDHETLVYSVARLPVSASAVTLSGLGDSELKVVRSASLGSWITNGPTVEAFGTLYIQPVLEAPGVGTSAAGLFELRFAHVLILEGAVKRGQKRGQRYAFVNCEILEDPLRDTSLVQPLSRAELVNPFLSSSLTTNEIVRIEELNMRIMNMSRVGLRRKAVEAYDVEASVSSLGLHRSIPGTMRVRLPRDAGVGTAVTISTGRQSVRAGSSRVKLSTVTDWFAQCVVRLDAENGASGLRNTFLAEMAEPLDTLDNIEPDSLLLDFAALEEAGFGSSQHWQRAEKTPAAWTEDSFLHLAFDEPIFLTKVAPPPAAASPSAVVTAISAPAAPAGTPAPAALVRRYEGTIDDGAGNVVTINLEVEGDGCRLVAAQDGLLGNVVSTGGTIPFERTVTRAKALRVSFDGGRVLYAAEGAHRSGNLRLAVKRLQASIFGIKSLDAVTTEKGDDVIKDTDTAFPVGSCFHAIEQDQGITGKGSTLVCGDAMDEVFDYLDIDENDSRLRWLHAKVQRKSTAAAKVAARAAAAPGATTPKPVLTPMGSTRGSLSASGLQEVVGQAIKNLAFLRRDPSDPSFVDEVARWGKNCTLPFDSKILRLRRGSDPGGKVSAIALNASARQEVAIVIPTYSKTTLVDEFARIESGGAGQHSIQLFWLLSGFTHACLEVGVTPLIFLRE